MCVSMCMYIYISTYMSQHTFDQNTSNTVSTKKGTSPRLQNNNYQKTKSHNTIIDNLGLSENRAPHKSTDQSSCSSFR